MGHFFNMGGVVVAWGLRDGIIFGWSEPSMSLPSLPSKKGPLGGPSLKYE